MAALLKQGYPQSKFWATLDEKHVKYTNCILPIVVNQSKVLNNLQFGKKCECVIMTTPEF